MDDRLAECVALPVLRAWSAALLRRAYLPEIPARVGRGTRLDRWKHQLDLVSQGRVVRHGRRQGGRWTRSPERKRSGDCLLRVVAQLGADSRIASIWTSRNSNGHRFSSGTNPACLPRHTRLRFDFCRVRRMWRNVIACLRQALETSRERAPRLDVRARSSTEMPAKRLIRGSARGAPLTIERKCPRLLVR
jgi:hypothetical protein